MLQITSWFRIWKSWQHWYSLTNSNPVVTSKTNIIKTVNQLKKSWITAQAKALPNRSSSLIWVIATMVLVIEVPILVPITIGMAYLKQERLGDFVFLFLKGQTEVMESKLTLLQWFWHRPIRLWLKWLLKNFASKLWLKYLTSSLKERFKVNLARIWLRIIFDLPTTGLLKMLCSPKKPLADFPVISLPAEANKSKEQMKRYKLAMHSPILVRTLENEPLVTRQKSTKLI